MESQQVKQIIIRELPLILQHDREMQDFILQLSRRHFADKGETTSRFDRVLDELRRDREENTRKWEANQTQINRMLDSIEALAKKHDSTIGARVRGGGYTQSSPSATL